MVSCRKNEGVGLQTLKGWRQAVESPFGPGELRSLTGPPAGCILRDRIGGPLRHCGVQGSLPPTASLDGPGWGDGATGRALNLRSTGRGFKYCSRQPWARCSHLCACITKQQYSYYRGRGDSPHCGGGPPYGAKSRRLGFVPLPPPTTFLLV